MATSTFRSILGFGLVFAHFVTAVTVFVFYQRGGFLFDEMTTTIALIVPMFAAHTSVVVRYVIRNRTRRAKIKKEHLSAPFIALSSIIVLLYLSSIVAIVYLKAYNIAFSTFEQFKTTLALVETVFAVYVASFVQSLFEGTE